jgi:hypothetical protein
MRCFRVDSSFHHDEWLAVLLVDFVNGADDVGVVQRRSGAGFALKSLQRLGVCGNLFGKELESDESSKLHVYRCCISAVNEWARDARSGGSKLRLGRGTG